MESPDLIALQKRYPCLGNVLPRAAQLVAELRRHPDAELETRFGKMREGRFVAGVPRAVMDSIIDVLQHSSYMKGEDEWREESDVFFADGDTHYRTRVQYDSAQMTVRAQTTDKALLAPSLTLSSTVDDKDVRISLKSEREIRKPPASVTPYLVRIKQRRRFVTDSGAWAFDLSMTWSGASRSEAEARQMQAEPTFEIECELIDAAEVLKKRSDAYIAASLLLKMVDFMAEGNELQLYDTCNG